MKTHGLGREIAVSIAIVAAVILGCMIYLWGPTLYFWVLVPQEKYMVIVPEGYEGPVLIAWQIPDGEIAQKEDDAWIYRLGTDGALLLQNDPPNSVIDISFWYSKESKNLESIPFNSCDDDTLTTGEVIVCTGGLTGRYKTRDLHPNHSFYITSTPNSRVWDTEKLLDRYLSRLVIGSN